MRQGRVRMRAVESLALLVALAVGTWGAGPRRGAAAEQVRLGPGERPRIVNGLTTYAYAPVGALLHSPGTPIDDDNAGLWCSGTLIGCETFLTAAHCVVDDLTPSHYRVYLQHAGVFAVTSVTKHPSYTGGNFPIADVAVVKLGERVTGIAPMAVNQTDPVPFVPATGTIVGFGQTEGGANDYGIKRAGLVQTLSCPSGLPSGATDTEVVCWIFDDPIGAPGADSNTCNGDSGGPLLLDLGGGDVVAGVTSGGTSYDCLPTDKSYDANVFTYRGFVLSQLGSDVTSVCGGLPAVGDAPVTVIGQSGTLSAGNLSDSYTVSVGAGMNAVRFALNGEDNGGFDANLYVKQGAGASPSNFDCKADGNSQFGACAFNLPAAGDYSAYVERVYGSGEYQLTATIFGGPPPVCGDGARDFSEQCDGADAPLCAGLCQPDCTCPAPVCGNDVVEQGESCDGADDAACPGVCSAACSCPPPCLQDDLYNIRLRSDATRLSFRSVLANYGGDFDGRDPRDGFTLVLTQGANTVTITIPPGDPGWAGSRPDRGRFSWAGSVNGVERIKAIDRSARSGVWKLAVRGRQVPGAANIDVDLPVDVRVDLDGVCAQRTY